MNISANSLYTTYKLSLAFYNANNQSKHAVGTGFGLKVDDLFMIPTCRHVVDPGFDPDGGRKFYGYKLTELEIRGKNLDANNEPTIDTVATVDAFKVFWPADNVTDVAVMAQFQTRDRRNLLFPPMESSVIPTAEQMADLSIGEPVSATGYVDQHDTLDLRPLLRSGKIASDPRYPFSIPMNDGSRQNRGPIVAYDCFSWGGLSGGPVVTGQIGSHVFNDGLYRPAFLAGINAGHLDSSSKQHSGLSYFYRIEALLSLINEVFRDHGRTAPYPWIPHGDRPQGTTVGTFDPEFAG